jgi:hypothetical protein
MRLVQTGQDADAWLSRSPEGYTVAAVCCCRQWAVDTEVKTPRMCCKGSTVLMGSAIWLASATGLVGVALGGLVSLAVSRQQIQKLVHYGQMKLRRNGTGAMQIDALMPSRNS